MKTLNQIKREIEDMAGKQTINRVNYAYFADQVVPKNEYPITLAMREMQGTNAWKVYQAAKHLNTQESWLDRACFRATINQIRLTAEREKHDRTL